MVTWRDLRDIADAVVRPLTWRLASMVRPAIVSGASGTAASVTANAKPSDGPAGEDHEAAEVVMPPGFTGLPVDGSDALLLCPGGDTGHPILVASSNARLPGVEPGEAAIHVHDVTTGARVVVRNNGDIEVQPGVGGVVRLGAASPAPAFAVARQGDPIRLDIASTAQLVFAALVLGDPGVLALLNGVAVAGPYVAPVVPPTGDGSITLGGTGAIST